MSKTPYLHFLLFGVMISLLSCNKDTSVDTNDSFQAALSFAINGENFSFVQEDQNHFDVTLTSKAQLGGPDSARITTLKGLGDVTASALAPRNALYISLNRFTNGFFISFDQLQEWTRTGLMPFARDGEIEEGIGIIWIDDQGEVWTTGGAIGEFRFTKTTSLPLTAFPDAGQFQQNSRFSILSSKTIEPQPSFDWAREVEIAFNAQLYNAMGEQIQLNNGLFRTRIDIYNNR